MNKKIALVTGAAGNVGSKIVERLKEENYLTVGIDLKESNADKSIICDISKREAIQNTVAEIEKEIGAIEAVVMCTGSTVNGEFEEVSMEEWKKLLDSWLTCTVNTCAAVGPYMVNRKGGQIVQVSADYNNTKTGYELDAAASSSVHAFIKSFACEVAPYHVIANVIFASVPFDLDNIAAAVSFLVCDKPYIVANVLSVQGQA